MDRDEAACFEKMIEWERRIRQLMDLYDRDRRDAFMARDRWDEARGFYKSLKEDLREERRRLQNGRGPRNAADERWYRPTVDEALAGLNAPTNHPPSKWHGNLYDALTDFSHMLSQMRSHFDLADGQADGGDNG